MSEFRGTVLTGEELIRRRTKDETILPVRGPKIFTPSGSWLESKQLQSLLDATKALLAEERVERESALARAEWDENLKIARVTRIVGHQFEKFGHEEDTTVFLYPEEALYLLETNHLEILYGGVSMSIQQAYMTLLNSKCGCTFLEYIVFSHLLKNGFKVLRHSPKRTVTRYERSIGLHPVKIKNKKSVGKSKKVAKENNSLSDKFKGKCIAQNVKTNTKSSVKKNYKLKSSEYNKKSCKDELTEDVSCVEVTVDGNSSSLSDIEILSEKDLNDIKSEEDSELDNECSSFSISDDSDCQVVFSKEMSEQEHSFENRNIEEINLSDSDESVGCVETVRTEFKEEGVKLEILNDCQVQECNILKEEQTNPNSSSTCKISQVIENATPEYGLQDTDIEAENNIDMDVSSEQLETITVIELHPDNVDEKNRSLVNNVSILSAGDICMQSFQSPHEMIPSSNIVKEENVSQSSVVSRQEIDNWLIQNESKPEISKPSKNPDEIEVIELDDEQRVVEDRWTILQSFPNAAGCDVVHCDVPPLCLCPPNVCPNQSQYEIILERLQDPQFGGSQKIRKNYSERCQDSYGNQRHGQQRNFHHNNSIRRSSRPFYRRFNSRLRYRGQPKRNTLNRGYRKMGNHERFYSPNHLTPQRDHSSFPPYMPGPAPFNQSSYEHNGPSPNWREFSHNSEMYCSSDRGFNYRSVRMHRYPRRKHQGNRISYENHRGNESNSEVRNDPSEGFISFNAYENLDIYYSQQTRAQHNKRHKDTSEENSINFCSGRKYSKQGRRGRLNDLSDFLQTINNEGQNIPSQSSSHSYSNVTSAVESPMQLQNSVLHDSSSEDSLSQEESSSNESSEDSSEDSMEEDDHDDESVHALLKPSDFKDIDEALKSLQIVKCFKLNGLTASSDESVLSIKFDLYLPSTPFRKSEPPLPDFRVVIMSPDQMLPSSRQLSFLEEGFDDGVPLLFAIASPDSVAFFLHSIVNFPQVTSKEKVQT